MGTQSLRKLETTKAPDDAPNHFFKTVVEWQEVDDLLLQMTDVIRRIGVLHVGVVVFRSLKRDGKFRMEIEIRPTVAYDKMREKQEEERKEMENATRGINDKESQCEASADGPLATLSYDFRCLMREEKTYCDRGIQTGRPQLRR